MSGIFSLSNDKKELLVSSQSEEKEISKIKTAFVETKTLLLRAGYFKTDFEVFKMYLDVLNTILKPSSCILLLFYKKFQIVVSV